MRKRKSYKQTFIYLFVFIIVGYTGCSACDIVERHTHKIVSNAVNEAMSDYLNKQLENPVQKNNGIDDDIIGRWRNKEKYVYINDNNITVYDYKNGEKVVSNIYNYLISNVGMIILDNNIAYKYEIKDDCLILKYNAMSTRDNIFNETEIEFTKTEEN